MNNNIIIFQTIAPIFFALLIIIFANNSFSRIIGFIASGFNLFLSSILYFNFSNDPLLNLNYFVGGIDPIFGIALKTNYLNSKILLLINICFFSVFSYLLGAKKDSLKYSEIFLILIFLTGMNGVILSNDIFNIFVFLEVSSISSYALVVNSRNLKSPNSAFIYLIFGSISASFYLIGVIFIYNHFGFLNIDLISKKIPDLKNTISPNLILGGFFVFCGLFLKFGIFPIYQYIVSVYQKSSSYITAIFSSISTKINFYLILLMFFSVFGLGILQKGILFGKIIGFWGLIGGLFFSIYANLIDKRNIKKILVFSSLAEMNYMLGFFIFGEKIFKDQEILKTLMLFFFNHSLSKTGLFLLFESFFSQKFIQIENKIDSSYYKKFHFSNWQKKLIDLYFLILISHSIGFPPTIGFFAKFSLLKQFAQKQEYFALIIFLCIIFFSVLYNLKIFFQYFQSKDSNCKEEIDDNKVSIDSFKMINFYNLFFSLSILIFCLIFFF
jgi:multicomponent Na+:H+ antiporter subunit D